MVTQKFEKLPRKKLEKETGGEADISLEEKELGEASLATKLAEEVAKTAKANKETMESEASEAKSKAERNAASLGMTLEKFQVAQDNILKLDAQYKEKIAELKEQEEALNSDRVLWDTRLKTLEDNEKLLLEEILRLREGKTEEQEREGKEAEAKAEAEVKAEEEEATYVKNYEKGISILEWIINKLEEDSTDLKENLEKKVATLNSLGFAEGKKVFLDAHTTIIIVAGRYQDNEKDPNGDNMAKWLFKLDDQLVETMDLNVEDETSDEPPMFTPPASTGFGRFLDRLAEKIKGI